MKNNVEIIEAKFVEGTTETAMPEEGVVTVTAEVKEKKGLIDRSKEKWNAFEEKHPKGAKAMKVAGGFVVGTLVIGGITAVVKKLGSNDSDIEEDDDDDTIDWCEYEDVVEFDGSAVDDPDWVDSEEVSEE